MQVESSQEANAEVMREMTRKLYSQYEEKLQEAQRKHSAEKEALLVRVRCSKQKAGDVVGRFNRKVLSPKGVMRLDVKRNQGIHSFIHCLFHVCVTCICALCIQVSLLKGALERREIDSGSVPLPVNTLFIVYFETRVFTELEAYHLV